MRQNSRWNEQNIYYKYLEDVSKYPLLTKAEERIILRKISEGSKAAEERLVLSNLRFVINIANMYKGQGLSINELISEGNIGLIEAARRFDVNQQIKFISYAVWWIRQAITRAISEKARLVRISAEKELVLRRFNKQSSTFKQVIGGQYLIDTEEIVNQTDYNTEQVESIVKMGLRHSSLDTPLGDEGDSTALDMTPSRLEMTDAQAEKESRIKFIKNQIKTLTVQEQNVISLYFGIDSEFSLNLQEIGAAVGLSKERVRQVKENALNKLRSMNLNIDDFACVA